MHIFPIIDIDVFIFIFIVIQIRFALLTLAFGIIFCQIETEVSSPGGFYLLMSHFSAVWYSNLGLLLLNKSRSFIVLAVTKDYNIITSCM
jgi:hypothetical protein